MIYKFRIISDEADDYLREIRIDADASFLDLHKALLKANNYKDDQLTSFFICDEDWEKETEITLEEMDSSSERDTYVMESTPLSHFLEDEKQKLLYVFDPLADRVFFMELSEIIPGKSLKAPVVSRSIGQPPVQTLDFDEVLRGTPIGTSLDLDETFYGDDDFDEEEFDPEGFDITDGTDNLPL